jgi:hypothetical protein
MKIAEAVDETWHRAYGSGRLEVPVSIVGALAFLSPPDDKHDDVAAHLLSLSANEFAAFVRMQWATFVNIRPDLVNRAWPLIAPWYGEQSLDQQAVSAAKDVADAAVHGGQLQLTGTGRRRETDLFGALLAVLRSRTAKSARGQFYTPACVADLMARMVGVPAEGERVLEPTVGTGGLLRSAAEAMRELNRDPSTVEWWAVDVDALAVACLAVNAVLWELGHKVVLGVGNGLTDDWIPRALGERCEGLELAAAIRRDKLMVDAVRQAEALVRLAASGPAE